jgi:anti-sigma factor RsiW
MKTNHLAEEQMQQYALDPKGCPRGVAEHVAACPQCKAAAAEYQVLFALVKAQPKPAFDFDVASLVMARIPQPQPRFSAADFAMYLLMAAAAILAACVPVLWFKEALLTLFAAISSGVLYAAAAIAATVIGLQALENYKDYRKKIYILNI